ncbi:hypothetical protein [Streptomyces flaveolus]|uniref:hypothetical protein n=1 Tax=Streptomyces flaveolus TaxID=67297 RepID=UPI0033D13458
MGYAEHPRRIVRPGQQGPQGQSARPLSSPGAGRRLVGDLGTPRRQATGAPGPDVTRRELYRPRPRSLREALHRLDAGLDDHACRSLAEWIREEYTTTYGAVPLGFVARCYLGPPYVDHMLNLFGVIVRHFAPAEPMPDPYSSARMLARSGGYAYIEVYSDGLILPVLEDGTVVRP